VTLIGRFWVTAEDMLWNFYHSVKPGDIIIARRGTKKIAGVGTVTRKAYYEQAKNAVGQENPYSNHIDVKWEAFPRDKQFSSPVFGMQTIYEISEVKFRSLVEAEPPPDGKGVPPEEDVQDQAEFVLEKYLEDFIVSNFEVIFRGKLKLYADPQQNITGRSAVRDRCGRHRHPCTGTNHQFIRGHRAEEGARI